MLVQLVHPQLLGYLAVLLRQKHPVNWIYPKSDSGTTRPSKPIVSPNHLLKQYVDP